MRERERERERERVGCHPSNTTKREKAGVAGEREGRGGRSRGAPLKACRRGGGGCSRGACIKACNAGVHGW